MAHKILKSLLKYSATTNLIASEPISMLPIISHIFPLIYFRNFIITCLRYFKNIFNQDLCHLYLQSYYQSNKVDIIKLGDGQ